MAQTTDIHGRALAPAPTRPSNSALRKVGASIKLVVTRSIFWAYERGSWQYDVIVIAILAFIFLSPRAWFNDRPTLQMTNLRHLEGITEIGRVNKEVTYLVDIRLVDSFNLKPEDAIPVILKQSVKKPFTVKSIDAWKDRHKVILGYTVVVEE